MKIHTQVVHTAVASLVASLVLRERLSIVIDGIHETSLLLFGGGLSRASLGATVGATALSAARADENSDEAAKTHDEAIPLLAMSHVGDE